MYSFAHILAENTGTYPETLASVERERERVTPKLFLNQDTVFHLNRTFSCANRTVFSKNRSSFTGNRTIGGGNRMAVVINRTAEGKNVPFSTLTHTFSGNNRTVNAEKRTVSSATTRLKPSTAGFFKHH